MAKERNLDQYEQSITIKFRNKLYSKFVKAIKEYKLIEPNDHIMVCISGGKDSMLMAKLFTVFHAHGDIPFDVTYTVMNPGYNEENFALIKKNLETLNIPAHIENTDIFAIANMQKKGSCFLCAKMRRGALYNIANKYGCNKIALGHHYDDVIETTLMNLLNSGSFQTMLPKLVSTNYEGKEVIRPMFYIREKDIIGWTKFCELHFIQCACRFTEESSRSDEAKSQRAATKKLIHDLLKYNDQVEQNLFIAAKNVNIDKILGYHSDEKGDVSFLDDYDKRKEEQLKRLSINIKDNNE